MGSIRVMAIHTAGSRIFAPTKVLSTWRHLLPLAGILCLCVGWPMLLAVFTGSLAIPHNDAWAYSLIAEHYARSGSIQLVGWNRAALVGQIVVLGPLGGSIVVQNLFVAVLA